MEHTRAFLAYDTLCRIAAELPEDGEQLLEQCEEEAHGLERTLSMFDPDSELSRLCRDIRPGEAVPVSETLYTFLEQNLEICRLSGGAFDPTVGPVVKLWDFLSQTPRIPSAERIRAVLDRRGWKTAGLVTPTLETLLETAREPELLFRALLTGDLLYAAPAGQRDRLAPAGIPGWEELEQLAERIGSFPASGRRLAAVGTPLCLTVLNDGVLDALEREGKQVLRAPLTEYLWFLWSDRQTGPKEQRLLDLLRDRMRRLSDRLGGHSAFSVQPEQLAGLAEPVLPAFNGGNGRYRWAKAMQMGEGCRAVLTLAPRYENTATVLDMRGIYEACPAPLFQMALDADWDESAWSRLRSFLHYC